MSILLMPHLPTKLLHFIGACMVLSFELMIKTVLITHQCFNHGWTVLDSRYSVSHSGFWCLATKGLEVKMNFHECA